MKFNLYSNFNIHLTMQTITSTQNLKFPNKSFAYENHPQHLIPTAFPQSFPLITINQCPLIDSLIARWSPKLD